MTKCVVYNGKKYESVVKAGNAVGIACCDL